MEFNIRTGVGEYDIEAHVRQIGADFLVGIYGGDRPHIGAVGAAHPRPSLRDSRNISATASVICYSGHKEDEIVKMASETLSSHLNVNTVVTAGIHWDALDADGIHQVRGNCKRLVHMIIDKISSKK